MTTKRFRKRAQLRRMQRRLASDKSGTALIEFAFVLPIFLTLSMYGIEVAYMASVDMQVSQIATSLADNASRLGQTNNSAVTPSISAGELDSVIQGALKQGGNLNLESKGRIIISSLEEDEATRRQYLHWQKCSGDLDRDSIYGEEGDGISDSTRIYGVGTGNSVTAPFGSAVMVAEVYYEHTGIFGDLLVKNVKFYKEGIYQIRDDRNLTPGVTGNSSSIDCD